MSNLLDSRVRIADIAGVLAGLVMVYFGGSYIVEQIQLHAPRPELPRGSSHVPQLGPSHVPQLGTPTISIPRLMTAPMLEFLPGRRYGVALDTPGVVPSSTVRSRAPDIAKELGFTDIDVFTDGPPPGWPGKKKGQTDADTWIVALYKGVPQSFPRSKSGVDVIEAWEG